MEKFFAGLEKAHVRTKPRYRTRGEDRAGLLEYTAGHCNSQRRHPALGQVSATDFEKRFSTQRNRSDCANYRGNSTMMGKRRSPASILLALATALGALSAPLAIAAFPDRPITMYVGFPPGGAADTTGRIVADRMSKILGQPVVAVTKSGGGGAVMASQLLRAPADGYTIGMGASSAYALTPQINKNIRYRIDDFVHLATLTHPSDAIVVKADGPWKTMDDLIKSAKKSGRPLSFASPVAASGLMVKAIAERTGVNFKVIPVEAGALGIQQVLGGHVDLAWSESGWIEQVRAGRLRPLATMSPERMADHPGIPTLLELGYDFALADTFMLSAPKGVPGDVVSKLSAAIEQAINNPEVRKALHDRSELLTRHRDSKDTLAFLKKQYADVEPKLRPRLREPRRQLLGGPLPPFCKPAESGCGFSPEHCDPGWTCYVMQMQWACCSHDPLP